MAKKKIKKEKKKTEKKVRKIDHFTLPEETKRVIFGILTILASVITALSFFDKAGEAGEIFMKSSRALIGESVFVIPLILFLAGIAFLNIKNTNNFFEKRKNISWPIILSVLILIFGFSGILGTFDFQLKRGGFIGYILSWPILKYFGVLAGRIIFLAFLAIGFLILWQFLSSPRDKKEIKKENNKDDNEVKESASRKPSIIKNFFSPKFKVREISDRKEVKNNKKSEEEIVPLKLETKPIGGANIFSYQPPPLNILQAEKGVPSTGDTESNSAIIKKTFHNFGIEVTMSEVNIGPTVTQYTLKPAEGIKLSKITNLSNNLSLALASHPIRIEAPIPGRSLVGIEIPNKTRSDVRLRNLIEDYKFQKSSGNLLVALGRDVSGSFVYADLTKMPHLLVAGSTGSGKTIFLNSLILSLLYQPTTFTKSAGPENLRFILVDPKRVEFSIYNNIPHLLCPIIYNADETISALKWLTGEMERRFDVLAKVGARDIDKYNERALKNKEDVLPFIVIVIDELADLMAARGKEIEAMIVRLAQMSRAVGIHLVLATQRPSVEVITGLIKANITSRVTFQVASQVDSRTIIDTSGAEKLLGAGDMLYVSTQTPKPRRIQSPYVSDKEVKKVIEYIISKNEKDGPLAEMDETLNEELKHNQRETSETSLNLSNEEDPLYDSARQLVVESKKASASLLQRRLRIGYARAARLIDILEEKGIVGPADGSRPREVYGENEGENIKNSLPVDNSEEEDDDGWKKV